MIKILKCFFLCGTVLTLLLGRGYAAVPPPSTPTGVALGSWLTAFNSGDAKLLKAFYDSYSWPGNIEGDQKLRSMFGELELLKIALDEKFRIEALLKASKEGRCRIRIEMNDKNPPKIIGIIILRGMTMPFPP